MEWYLKVMQNHYTDFSGRARRKEFWMFMLIYMVIICVAMVLDNMLGLQLSVDGGMGYDIDMPYGYIYILTVLAHFIPGLAVSVRRLHDCDKSGWFLLLAMIPFVNIIGVFVVFYFYCINGTSGDNQYGSDPKAS